MTQMASAWNEALRLRLALTALGLGEGEIAFPESASGTLCFVSESISEAPHITPTLAQAVREAIQPFREALEGRTIRYQADRVDLLEGDSWAFLVAWSEGSQVARSLRPAARSSHRPSPPRPATGRRNRNCPHRVPAGPGVQGPGIRKRRT